MRKSVAAYGSSLFLALAPGTVAVLLPWWLTGWRAGGWWQPLRLLGLVPLAAGTAVLLMAFARFVTEGLGTPAPVAPTERLVVGGLYRYVRNPMYVAVDTTIAGQALLLARPVLFVYGGCAGLLMWAFARWYEEPDLARRFGADYDRYREAVPGWWPRSTPWDPDSTAY
ncbi:isoprenylcysteine carboxylmethyltransferase family protein [Streptomyces sp. MBT62]|uniref:methyltransferase family protein n=1 Tax=Streptomyces sp. MBT62 TaxID=2800410 RepID=UPI00190C8480|nr:isoprenylcysteine carboxylmethyltransferase family protein [Streptomyces sp. MBT62]MBK3564393.1 isoprenylcysteine carboxylmethyltransferase family protein [Streptomyces sp. MBT62]